MLTGRCCACAQDIERTVAWLATTGWADPARLFPVRRIAGRFRCLDRQLRTGQSATALLFYPLCGSCLRPRAVPIIRKRSSSWRPTTN